MYCHMDHFPRNLHLQVIGGAVRSLPGMAFNPFVCFFYIGSLKTDRIDAEVADFGLEIRRL